MSERQLMSTVRLSSQELLYLKNTAFLGQDLLEVIDSAERQRRGYLIHVSRDIAEQFRSAFTERLARRGFDSAYDLTREGKVLEELIDKFFIRESTS